MTGKPLFETNDPKFPAYFRLYWSEVEDIIKKEDSFRINLAEILKSATGDDWFNYAIEVFADPKEAVLKSKPPKLRVTKKKGNQSDEEIKREYAEKLSKFAELLKARTFSTFVYEALFNDKGITYIDDFINKHCLWDLEKYLNNAFCRDQTTRMDHKIRFFLRELPRSPAFNEDFFYDIIDFMVKGGHIAALSILLPDWDLVCQQKKEEKEQIRNRKRQIQNEDDVIDQDLLEMRLIKEHRKNMDSDEPYRTLCLRDYQEELVEHARQGKNTIVVAPTGAGKTEVCIYIAREHIEKREKEKKPSRVVMLVPKIPLVEQQECRFRDYLKHKYVINGFHGAMNFTGEVRTEKFLNSHIIVMTPEILYNMLRSVRKSERVYLADISLIIFDEVHHCRSNHVYNRIMQFIHDYPHATIQPQILGLTATPLPTAQTDEKSSLDAIFELMANANCYILSTVVRHIDSLEKQVSKPDEVFYKEDPGLENEFLTRTKTIIGSILNMIRKDLSALVKETKAAGSHLTPQEAQLKYSTPFKFVNQLNVLRDKLSKLAFGQVDKMKLFIAVDYLIVLGRSLTLNELMPCNFAVEFLETEMNKVRDQYGSKSAEDLYAPYNDETYYLNNTADRTIEDWTYDRKPIVNRLIEVLKTQFNENSDTRCIIFVQERAMAKRLMRFLNTICVLGSNNLVAFVTSTKGGGLDGMTAEEQRNTLAKFHRGDIKIIVATSVLDEGIDVSACNLIIKYNTSSSAVAKIQRAGRVRAKGGKSIFICLHDGIAASEYVAILTGNMMKKCVKTMAEAGPRQIKTYVDLQKQRLKNIREDNKKRDEENRRRLQGNRYDIVCRTCRTVICDGDNIRVDGSHYCVVDEDIWRRLCINVAVKKGAKFVDNEHQILGQIYCIGEENIEDLGEYWRTDEKPIMKKCGNRVGDVYKIAGTYFPVLVTSEINFLKKGDRVDDESEPVAMKNWTKVANELFYISDLREADLKRMLHAMDGIRAPECQRPMKLKLDIALERVFAEYNRETARKQAELERRERIRIAPKEQFQEYNYGDLEGSEYTGFDTLDSDDENA